MAEGILSAAGQRKKARLSSYYFLLSTHTLVLRHVNRTAFSHGQILRTADPSLWDGFKNHPMRLCN